mgnify:CR=1 FL=1
MSALRADYFGRRALGAVMGLSAPLITLGSVGGPLLAGFLADRTGDYRLGFALLAVLAGLGTLFFVLARRPQPRRSTVAPPAGTAAPSRRVRGSRQARPLAPLRRPRASSVGATTHLPSACNGRGSPSPVSRDSVPSPPCPGGPGRGAGSGGLRDTLVPQPGTTPLRPSNAGLIAGDRPAGAAATARRGQRARSTRRAAAKGNTAIAGKTQRTPWSAATAPASTGTPDPSTCPMP